MVQTDMSSDSVYIADGAKAQIALNTPTGTPEYINMGVTKGDAEFSVKWKETKTKSGNAGYFDPEIKDMTVEGKFTLYTKKAAVMAMLGGGLVQSTTDAAESTTPGRIHITGGSSYVQFVPVEFCFEHTDSANRVRGIKIFNCTVSSGSLGFKFMGADSEGRETMEVSFVATPDPARTEGKSLYDYYVDPGAL